MKINTEKKIGIGIGIPSAPIKPEKSVENQSINNQSISPSIIEARNQLKNPTP